ncbi:MAG: ribose-phosphate pyrophosphokinase [Firmicutes bacterium]|nr:ribose-phosphate pyrophosphokinase [Bacillota bacterium]
MTAGRPLRLFSCNANRALAEEIAAWLDLPLSACEVGRFRDGEIQVRINESVRGADVFVLQPTCAPVNEHLMELLVTIDALRRASAARITAVIPYYGYARQDRKARARDPITAKLVANLITVAGADRVLTMDLHAGQIQGFFDIPVDHLLGVPILADYFAKKGLEDMVVVSPDVGGVTRARNLADRLDVPIAIIDKYRPEANVAQVMNVIGSVKNKRAILIDDIIDTAGTITQGAQALIDRGAIEVYACCTHAVLSPPAVERLTNSVFKEVVVTNTIPLAEEARIPLIKQLSVAPLFGQAIRNIHRNLSVSTLFD